MYHAVINKNLDSNIFITKIYSGTIKPHLNEIKLVPKSLSLYNFIVNSQKSYFEFMAFNWKYLKHQEFNASEAEFKCTQNSLGRSVEIKSEASSMKGPSMDWLHQLCFSEECMSSLGSSKRSNSNQEKKHTGNWPLSSRIGILLLNLHICSILCEIQSVELDDYFI